MQVNLKSETFTIEGTRFTVIYNEIEVAIKSSTLYTEEIDTPIWATESIMDWIELENWVVLACTEYVDAAQE